MRLINPIAACVALGLLLTLDPPASHATVSDAPVALAGTWKLNKELSDDPGRKMMEAMRDGNDGSGRGGRGGGGMGGGSGRGGGGGGGRGGGGGGGMSGGGGRGGSGRNGFGEPGSLGGEPPLDGTPAQQRPREEGSAPERGQPADGDPRQQRGRGLRGMMGLAPSPEFVIEQEGENLAFRTESNLRLLHSDGEKRKKEGASGPIEVVARFLKGSLLVESRPERGGKRKETYTLRADGKLQVDFDFDSAGPMPGLKFKLVYDPSPPKRF